MVENNRRGRGGGMGMLTNLYTSSEGKIQTPSMDQIILQVYRDKKVSRAEETVAENSADPSDSKVQRVGYI